VEHGLSPNVIGEAYGVTLPPVRAPHGSFERHRQYLKQQVEMNRLTGRCNLELPYHYTMAPRIVEGGSFHGVLTDEASLSKLVFVELTGQHWDEFRRLVDEKGEYAVNACITTGIGHLWQTMDLMAFSVAAIENPGLLRTILQRYTEWTCQVVAQCNRAGVDFFWCFDDFAFKTGPVYSPEVLREVVMPYARMVAAEIRLPWIWHSDGNYMVVLEDILSLGMNALNPLEPGCIDLEYLLTAHPDIVLVGGVDVDVLARGSMAETRQTVRECYGLLNRNGRYIAASANSIPGYCKPQNVKALYDEIALLSCTSISPGKQELSSDS
jgi:uroporphyrinogen decarboxylase